MMTLTNRQTRQFVLLRNGLLGAHKFVGKPGALDFVRQAGCIQFDPVDVCGKNAELTLQSRVRGFTKATLDELLYKDRLLFDYPDKNLAIIPTEYWPYFARYRNAAKQSGLRFDGLLALEAQAKAHIAANGCVNSSDLPLEGQLHWHSAIHWSGGWQGDTNAARAVLEQLYSTGELVIHHKRGARKFYDLAERHISAERLRAPDPLPDEFEHQKWRVQRRIGAVGLLWNRPSDAWLNIWGLNAQTRNEVFAALCQEGKILPLAVEGIKDTLYCRAEDATLLAAVLQNPTADALQCSTGLQEPATDALQCSAALPDSAGTAFQMPVPTPRCELIAPLDPLMWDRKLIRALFGFDYTWEIYTPAVKRKYGVYALPLLYGERFAGRVEAIRDRKTETLTIQNIWYEPDTKQTKAFQAALNGCLKRFAKFHDCELRRVD